MVITAQTDLGQRVSQYKYYTKYPDCQLLSRADQSHTVLTCSWSLLCHCSGDNSLLLLLSQSLYPAVQQISHAPRHRFRVAEKERTKNADGAFRLLWTESSITARCLDRSCTRLLVSCGKGTAWVMAGVINDGTAHNHPLLQISICLILCLTASGRFGWTQRFYHGPPCSNSKDWGCHFWITSNTISTGPDCRQRLRFSAASAALTLTSLLPGI